MCQRTCYINIYITFFNILTDIPSYPAAVSSFRFIKTLRISDPLIVSVKKSLKDTVETVSLYSVLPKLVK